MLETGETWLGGHRKICRQENVGSAAAVPDNYPENSKSREGSARHSGLKCRLCPVLSEVFVVSIIIDGAWEDQRKWHRMTRMTGPDCAVMCNFRSTHTHLHRQRVETYTWYPVFCNYSKTIHCFILTQPPPPPHLHLIYCKILMMFSGYVSPLGNRTVNSLSEKGGSLPYIPGIMVLTPCSK